MNVRSPSPSPLAGRRRDGWGCRFSTEKASVHKHSGAVKHGNEHMYTYTVIATVHEYLTGWYMMPRESTEPQHAQRGSAQTAKQQQHYALVLAKNIVTHDRHVHSSPQHFIATATAHFIRYSNNSNSIYLLLLFDCCRRAGHALMHACMVHKQLDKHSRTT